jgi:hypothetical protein
LPYQSKEIAVASQRPASVPESAQKLWDLGVDSTNIYAGDLWVLSWDRVDIGLALVAAAKNDYVLAWPVTLPGEPSFAPGLVLDESPLNVPVTLWPTRETGIGNHLLDRKFGQLMTAERIRPIAFALDDGEDPGLPFATGSARDENYTGADRALIDHWTSLCFHTAGIDHDMRLDSARVRAAGGSSRIVGELLGLPPQRLRPIWEGVDSISEEQVSALAQTLGVNYQTLLRVDPLAAVVTHLSSPKFKRAVVYRAGALNWTEEAVRNATRHEFALAARDDDDSNAVVDRKLFDAIGRVGR